MTPVFNAPVPPDQLREQLRIGLVAGDVTSLLHAAFPGGRFLPVSLHADDAPQPSPIPTFEFVDPLKSVGSHDNTPPMTPVSFVFTIAHRDGFAPLFGSPDLPGAAEKLFHAFLQRALVPFSARSQSAWARWIFQAIFFWHPMAPRLTVCPPGRADRGVWHCGDLMFASAHTPAGHVAFAPVYVAPLHSLVFLSTASCPCVAWMKAMKQRLNCFGPMAVNTLRNVSLPGVPLGGLRNLRNQSSLRLAKRTMSSKPSH